MFTRSDANGEEGLGSMMKITLLVVENRRVKTEGMEENNTVLRDVFAGDRFN